MKFVYNEEKNEAMRHILMMQPTVEEAKAKLDKDDTDAAAWYEYGTALSLVGKYEEALEAHSHGIAYDPFYAPNYFGRGRRQNAVGRTWAALADFTVAIHLDSDCWTYWYYRATTLNLNGHLEESIDDFRECMRLSNPAEHYPLIHWIYTTYVRHRGAAPDGLRLLPRRPPVQRSGQTRGVCRAGYEGQGPAPREPREPGAERHVLRPVLLLDAAR